jgi:hypothetical protein
MYQMKFNLNPIENKEEPEMREIGNIPAAIYR